MHVTTKEVDDGGAHILTSVIEGDGAVALASEKAAIEAKVISVQRTSSGGIQVQTAVFVKEPTPEKPADPEPSKPEPTPKDKAVAYFVSKGYDAEAAVAAVEKFGVERVLQAQAEELDNELRSALSPAPTPKADA